MTHFAEYTVEVDWDGDNSFDHANTDISADVRHVTCIKGARRGAQLDIRASAGQLIINLNNLTGTYSPFNTNSPIYGLNLPGRRIRVKMDTTIIWAGFLASIVPHSMPVHNTARLLAYGPFFRLSGSFSRINPPASSGPMVEDVLDVILDEAGWPAGDRDFDAGVVPINTWYGNEVSAFDAMVELAHDMEQGTLTEGTAWNIVFRNRYSRLTTYGASQATFSDLPGAELAFTHIEEEDHIQGVYNKAEAKVQPFEDGGAAVLWQLDEVPYLLNDGDSVVFVATYPDVGSDPAAAYATWGTPEVSYFGPGSADVTLVTDPQANKLTMTFENTNGTGGWARILSAFVAGTTFNRGTPFSVVSNGTPSQALYGVRTYPYSARWFDSAIYAQAAVDYIVDTHKDPLPTLRMEFTANGGTALTAQAKNRNLNDRITIQGTAASVLGINGDFHIEGITHTIDHNEFHTISWYLSRAGTITDYWQLGVGSLGTETRLAF